MPYTPSVAQVRRRNNQSKELNFMKTNTIQAIVSSVALGLIAGFGATRVSGESVIGVAVTLSCLAVAALFVIAASDYRSGPKAYFGTSLTTSHFKRSTPASGALRTANAKSRMAA